MNDPTLGGFLPRFEADEATEACIARHFPGAGYEPSREERLARLAGADVATLPEGKAIYDFMKRRHPGAF